jgi:hypothetical protein
VVKYIWTWRVESWERVREKRGEQQQGTDFSKEIKKG